MATVASVGVMLLAVSTLGGEQPRTVTATGPGKWSIPPWGFLFAVTPVTAWLVAV